MLYTKDTVIESVYRQYFAINPCILIGRQVKGINGFYCSTSLHEIMGIYNQYISTSPQYLPVCILYHVFSMMDVHEQQSLIEWLQKNTISFVAIDYTLTERTLEWFCSFIKYIIEFPRKREIYMFLAHGGLHGLLYRNALSISYSVRFPLTQELLVVQNYYKNV